MASNSVLHCLYLDLRRGLTNKRFWTVLGILSAIFLLYVIVTGIWPLTVYYIGGEERYPDWGGRIYTRQSKIEDLTQLAVFANFFPFLGAAAYAYTIIDDRRHRYYLQQVQRVGFSRYYWCKLIASGLLGGLIGALCMGVICLIPTLVIAWNPFISGAVDYYNGWETLYKNVSYRYVGWGFDRAFLTVTNPWAWWALGGLKYFVMGMFFGLLSGMMALFTDNSVILYAGPVIYLLLEDKWLYMCVCLFRDSAAISTILRKFSQRAEIGAYGNLYHYSLLIFLIILLLNLARHFRDRVERLYMEEKG